MAPCRTPRDFGNSGDGTDVPTMEELAWRLDRLETKINSEPWLSLSVYKSDLKTQEERDKNLHLGIKEIRDEVTEIRVTQGRMIAGLIAGLFTLTIEGLGFIFMIVGQV